MDSIAKTELGYRYGDKYSITNCSISSYNPFTAQYNATIKGTWNNKIFHVSAIIQDNNGALILVKVKDVNVAR